MPEGSGDVDREMVPEKPLVAVRLIADVTEDPWGRMNEVGLADMLKSTGPLRSQTCISGPKYTLEPGPQFPVVLVAGYNLNVRDCVEVLANVTLVESVVLEVSA